MLVSCAPWNLGDKFHSRDEWTVIFGFDEKEQGGVMEQFCNKLQEWIVQLEQAPLLVGDIVTHHTFIPSADQKMLAYVGGQFGQSFSRFSILAST